MRRLLTDDDDGSRHQRFVLQLRDRDTLLIAHNIDLSKRVPLGMGDRIKFRGMYEWNELGGLVHWTHHDPHGDEWTVGWISLPPQPYKTRPISTLNDHCSTQLLDGIYFELTNTFCRNTVLVCKLMQRHLVSVSQRLSRMCRLRSSRSFMLRSCEMLRHQCQSVFSTSSAGSAFGLGR